jgi:hypothetical protein
MCGKWLIDKLPEAVEKLREAKLRVDSSSTSTCDFICGDTVGGYYA